MARWKGLRRSPRVVLALVTAAIFADMALYDLVVPFLPEYLRDRQATPAAIGLFFSSYAVAFLAASPLMGVLSERAGRRVPLLGGTLGLLVSAGLYASGEGMAVLYAARIVQGVAGAALWTSGLALVADHFCGAARGRALGALMTGISVASLVGPPVGGALFDMGGYRLPFVLSAGAIACLGMALAALLPPPARPAEPRRTALATPWGDGGFITAAGAVLVGTAVLSLLEPTLPLFLEDQLLLRPTTIGVVFAIATIAFAVTAPLAERAAHRWGRVPVMAVGLGATAVTLPLAALPSHWLGAAAALTPLGIALALLLEPALPELADAADRSGNTGYGIAYVYFGTCNSMGLMVGPLIGGVLTTRLSFLSTLVVVAGGVAICGAILAVLARRRGTVKGTSHAISH